MISHGHICFLNPFKRRNMFAVELYKNLKLNIITWKHILTSCKCVYVSQQYGKPE